MNKEWGFHVPGSDNGLLKYSEAIRRPLVSLIILENNEKDKESSKI